MQANVGSAQTYYFTSISANYFAKARVLGKSLKKFNPTAKFIVVLCDKIPESVRMDEEIFDDILTLERIRYIDNINAFSFKHTVTELCTAVKPMAALEIMECYSAGSIIYLDPDIAVFNSLEELERMFEKSSILLTPHQLKPEVHDLYVRENEILFLKRGSYNFGFFGVKADEEGKSFLNWWRERLQNYCFDDNYDCLPELSKDGLLGLFTDQKWADLIPSFFENYYIIRSPGYNVCTWNLTRRHLTIDLEGRIAVDGEPLCFFHFSGFDSGAHHNELQKLLNVEPQNKDVWKLSKWYKEELQKNGQKIFEKIPPEYTVYSNGEIIRNADRKLFHIRKDVHKFFPDPYQVNDGFCFYTWVRTEYPQYFNEKQNVFRSSNKSNWKKTANKIFPAYSWLGRFIRKIYRLLRNM